MQRANYPITMLTFTFFIFLAVLSACLQFLLQQVKSNLVFLQRPEAVRRGKVAKAGPGGGCEVFMERGQELRSF